MKTSRYQYRTIRLYAIAVLIVSLILSNSSVAQLSSEYQSRTGGAADYVVVGPNNYFGNRPVLSSFSFDYFKEDHHFQEVSILPEYGPFRNQLGFRYSDDSSEHTYRYSISLALVNPNNVLAEGTISGFCRQDFNINRRRGWCARTLPEPPESDAVFVLSAFYLIYL